MKKTKGTKRAWLRYLITLIAFALALNGLTLVFPAQVPAANPSSGQVKVTGRVNGPPPTTASTINSPKDGETFNHIPIKVSGTCPSSGLIIKIVDNRHFVGSAICTNSGTFSLNVSLFKGKNQLVAQEFDSLDQKGPDSEAVTVYYNPLTSSANNYPANPAVSQLLIDFDSAFAGYTGCNVDQQFNLPLRIKGGKSPYAVNIDWGDGSRQLVSLKSSKEPILASHTYDQAGAYQITVTATDQSGQTATLEIAIIIDGKPKSLISAIGSAGRSYKSGPLIYTFGLMSVLVVGYIMGKHGRAGHTTQST